MMTVLRPIVGEMTDGYSILYVNICYILYVNICIYYVYIYICVCV